MTKEDYLALKTAVPPSHPWGPTLAIVLFDGALLASAWTLLTFGGIAGWAAAQPILCLFYFHAFALLHEAGHGNLHDRPWVNDALGHIFSVFCFLPYYSWKLIHAEHHVWAGSLAKDPALKNLKKARDTGKLPLLTNFAWRTWIPLAGFLQQIVFWFYPVDLTRTPGVDPGRKRKALLSASFSVFWLITAYIAIACLSHGRIHFLSLLPSLFLYFAMTEMVNLPHHLGTATLEDLGKHQSPPWEQHLTTRSCAYSPEAISKLVTMNFNYHTEHHLLPRVSWWQLPEVKRLAVPLLAGEYQVSHGLSWTLENRKAGLERVVFPKQVSWPHEENPDRGSHGIGVGLLRATQGAKK